MSNCALPSDVLAILTSLGINGGIFILFQNYVAETHDS